jgi:hypothetical protein
MQYTYLCPHIDDLWNIIARIDGTCSSFSNIIIFYGSFTEFKGCMFTSEGCKG